MKTKGRKDINQTAYSVARQATGEIIPPKENAVQKSGRRGGLLGGAARARNLTPERRSEIARKAAQARWSKSR